MGKIEKISTIFTFLIVVFFVSTCKVGNFSQALNTITLANAIMNSLEEDKYEYDVFLNNN